MWGAVSLFGSHSWDFCVVLALGPGWADETADTIREGCGNRFCGTGNRVLERRPRRRNLPLKPSRAEDAIAELEYRYQRAVSR